MDFGIDFGTTNSACTGIQNKRQLFNYGDEMGNPFPSIIVIDRVTGQVFCGREAWRKRQELAESCEVIPSIKTLLGTNRTWRIAGKKWTPVEVTAEVFKGLKKRVKEGSAKKELTSAVVAVPVDFEPEKRASLRKAAAVAEVEITDFISEPTAAIFSNYKAVGRHRLIAVVDWGGGTLDVSIVENRNGEITELATNGIYMGGDNIDLKLAEWAHNQVLKNGQNSLAFEQMTATARDKMIAECELAKKDLTYDDLVEISVINYGSLGDISISLDIDTFTKLIRYNIEDAVKCFENTVASARTSIEELECVIMIGGSINIRPFEEKMREICQDKIYIPTEADWSVARGAAWLRITPGHYKIAQSIGVVMSDGSFFPLIDKGDTVIDKHTTSEFALVEESTTANFTFSDKNLKTLGYLNIPTFGFFKEKINIETIIDKDLILRVTGKSQSRAKETSRTWSFGRVLLNYELPVPKKR